MNKKLIVIIAAIIIVLWSWLMSILFQPKEHTYLTVFKTKTYTGYIATTGTRYSVDSIPSVEEFIREQHNLSTNEQIIITNIIKMDDIKGKK